MDVPLIRIDDVHKSYDMGKGKPTVSVLRGASLEVHEGQTAAIVGLSGAGKSTLLHIMGALDRPNSGRVVLRGEDMYTMPERRRTMIRNSQIGLVFQSYHLFYEMDVLENVMMPALARCSIFHSVFPFRKRALDLLDFVGLANRADHTPLELSGGEQQRVALARALMNNPELMLADEPTGNLDNKTGRQILDYLFQHTKQPGHTMIMVTHNEVIAAECDRVFRLRDGILVEE